MPLMGGDESMKHSGNGDTEVPVEDSARGTKGVVAFTCEECGRAFRRRSNLSRHLRLHSGERPFECPQCCRLFAHSSSLRHHLRLHTGERPYQCSVCLRTFRQRPNYSLHLKTHTGEKHFRCLACGKEFAQRVHLTTHARLHSGELPYACQDCGRRFSQRCHLTRHRGTRGGEPEHLCHLCGGKFLSRSCLSSHLKTHEGGTHLQRVQKQCRSQQRQQDKEEGLSGARGKGQAVSVVRGKTQGVSVARGRVRAKVECEVCHKTFRTTSHLRHHRYTHTGERPYPCPQCGRRFSEAGSLRRHMTSHIRAHLKHTHGRSTPTPTHTSSTPIHEGSGSSQHQEIYEGFSITNVLGGVCNPTNGDGVSCITTVSSPPHHHTSEDTEVVCKQVSAVCITSNDCLPLSVTVVKSSECCDERLTRDGSGGEGMTHWKEPLTSQSIASPPCPRKRIETTEKQTHNPVVSSPPDPNQHSQSQIRACSCPQNEDMEGKVIKTDVPCDDREDMAGCSRVLDGLGKEEGRINHTNRPYSSPLRPQPLVAVSLFLFGKRVKEEAGNENEEEEESVKEELELIEEAV